MTACAPQGYEAIEGMASQTVDDIACKDQKLEEKLWDGLKTFLIEQKSIPQAADLKSALHDQLDKLAQDNSQLTTADLKRIQADLDNLVETLLSEAPNGERVATAEDLLLLLSAIDVGDRSTVFRSYMQTKVRSQFGKLEKTVQSFDLNCNTSSGSEGGDKAPTTGSEKNPETGPATSTEEVAAERNYEFHKQQALQSGDSLAVFGGRWAFASAYQSCQSLQAPSMNAQTPDIEGVKITGTHSDGIGSKRMIASLSDVQRTHVYIKDLSTVAQGCFNVRSNPLIYDYGGKPYGTTASNSPIDFFKNNGSGTSVLGVDCSAYVYSSLATAGLRLKEGRALKASDSWAWGSRSYLEPANNGLTCLAKIKVTPQESLKAGDVVAVSGHVLLIDKVGSDPFGIKSVSKESDCSKLASNVFDFVVAQSSPSKGGIGINYFEARDYLPTSDKMRTGLEKYAYYACLAKFNGKTYTPSLGTLSIIRHKGTTACIAPRVPIAKEACIQECGSLRR